MSRLTYAIIALSIAVLLLAEFALDIQSSRGIAEGMLYAVPVLIALWLPWRRVILLVAGASTLFIVLGFFLTPPDGLLSAVLLNRIYSTITIWVLAFLGYQRNRLVDSIVDIYDNVDHQVQERTAELASTNKQLQQEIQERQRSQTLYQGLLEATPDAILVFDHNGNVEYANKQAEVLFGYALSDLLGKPPEVLLPDNFKEVHVQLRQGFYQSPRPRIGPGISMMGRRKDGSFVPIDITLNPVQTSEGTRVIAGLRDVTEQRKLQQALEASEANYRSLVENLPDVVYRVTGDPLRGQVDFVSSQVARLLGCSPEAFYSDPDLFFNSLHPDDIASVMEQTKPLLAGAARATRAYRMRHQGTGEYRHIEDTVVVRQDAEGRPLGLDGVARDVTERVMLGQALQEREAQYRAVVENAHAGFAITRGERYLFVSAAFVRIYGHADEAEALATLRGALVLPEDSDLVRQRLMARQQGEQTPAPIEFRIRRRDGEVRILQGSGVPITYNGQPARLSEVLDITEQRKVEETLRESEANYRAVVENAQEGISIRVAGRLVYANQSFLDLYGLDLSQVLGSLPGQFVLPEYQEEIARRVTERLQGQPGEGYFEYRVRRPNGDMFVVQGSSIAITYGGHPASLAILRDVTEQRRMEQAVKESEANYRAVVENSSDGIVVHANEKYVLVNSAFLRIYGLDDPGQVIGAPVGSLALPEYQDSIRQRVAARLRGENVPDHLEYYVRRTDAQLRPLQVAGTAITYQGGPATMAVVRDITERVRLEEELRDANSKLHDALRELQQTQDQIVRQERLNALGQMASGVVHDFNNTLTPIIGFSALLLQRPALLEDRETALNYIRRCNAAAQDAARIVNRLREFYRPREQAEAFAPLDLNTVVERALATTEYVWKNQAGARGQPIAIVQDLWPSPKVLGNEGELTEVMTNLILNAVDAMPQGGQITLRTRFNGDRVSLEVADTGIGMREEVRARCFEPFFTTKGDKGTGMGLAVAYGVIQRHGGVIDVASEVGKGTTFSIHLPAGLT